MPANSAKEAERPPTWKVLVLATRPNTLAASFTPVLVGFAVASRELGALDPAPAFRFWVFACLIQIGTNLHNDYADFVKGADTDDRVGQARARDAEGLAVAGPDRGPVDRGARRRGVHRRVPREAAGLRRLDDVRDDHQRLQRARVHGRALSARLRRRGRRARARPRSRAAAAVGCLATAIIVVNNLRDRHTDVRAGKRTLAVRFGGAAARAEYLALVLAAYGAVAACVALRAAPAAWLLPLLSAPLAAKTTRSVFAEEGAALNAYVGGTAKLQLLFGLLLTAGVYASG
ncbi:hypothetical protein JL720_10503 [Aureococcus anophagefferens]|nr:hypothetical protein JL720_10503 [Aureococcus anophagefferens]